MKNDTYKYLQEVLNTTNLGEVIKIRNSTSLNGVVFAWFNLANHNEYL